MNFAKMNGLGNDYVFFDGTKKNIGFTKETLIGLCDRNFGIGGDGVVIVSRSQKCDFKMTIYNSDGSKAEMCGNALRCLAVFVYKNKLTDKRNLKIETDSGIRYVTLCNNDYVVANMGKPIFSGTKKYSGIADIYGYNVNVGNPHFVVFCDEINEKFDKYAKDISENIFIFPQKTNVEFVKIVGENCAEMRVYERGAKETLACGTGATAVFNTATELNILKDNATIKLKGGELFLKYSESGEVLLKGEAKLNFIGEIYINNGE